MFDAKTKLSRVERYLGTGGRYTVRDLPGGRYSITVHAGQRRSQTTVDLADGERKAGVDFDFDGGTTVRGRVIDLVTKQPVPGITLSATQAANDDSAWRFGDRDPTAVTDAAGRFSIEHVPSGRVTIRGYGDASSKYGWVGIVREVDGTRGLDVGDLGILKSRLDRGAPIAGLGITWAEYPEGTPSDQRSFKVVAIDPAGPAAKTALQVGDIVVTIDGIDVLGGNR